MTLGSKGKAADTTGVGFSRTFDTAPHAVHLVDAVLQGQIQAQKGGYHRPEKDAWGT